QDQRGSDRDVGDCRRGFGTGVRGYAAQQSTTARVLNVGCGLGIQTPGKEPVSCGPIVAPASTSNGWTRAHQCSDFCVPTLLALWVSPPVDHCPNQYKWRAGRSLPAPLVVIFPRAIWPTLSKASLPMGARPVGSCASPTLLWHARRAWISWMA